MSQSPAVVNETQNASDQAPAVNVAKENDDKAKQLTWPVVIACAFGALCCLYVFLVGLGLMGSAFKVLGGKGAGNMYGAVDNPLGGLMTGILSTVLVQSSSTSTSIVVTMVGAGQLTVKNGIPVIMGANIGTSVTNTIVSMGQFANRIDLERAFAGATVHDMFNMLTVLTLLPLEAIIAGIQGEGGPLYWLTYMFTEAAMGGEKSEKLFTSPIKTITKPVSSNILSSNKYVIYALTLGRPEAMTPQSVNTTLCDEHRRLTVADSDDVPSRDLLNRRLGDSVNCKEYFCVSKNLDKNFKKISKKSYKKLTQCEGYILDSDGEPCGKDPCYLDAGEFYDKKVTNGRLVKGGFLEGVGDVAGGILALIISLLMLTLGMMGLTKQLSIIFMGNLRGILRLAVRVNDYVAILIGLGITLVVQSSSVTTSALTPLCGLGVLPLLKMLPMTLGANIGTTCTALIASLVSLKFGAVQIALCHLWFNLVGILIWFPIPFMRQVPIYGAKTLGLYASYYRFLPPLYILVMFVCVPGLGLGISALYDVSIAGGVILSFVVLMGIAAGVFFWAFGYPLGGENALCYQVLSKEDREKGIAELAAANAAIIGHNILGKVSPHGSEQNPEASASSESSQQP